MSEKIEPAMTAEEWKRGAFSDENGTSVDADEGIFTVEAHDPLPGGEWRLRARADVQRRHAVAALALHGQPFGFTREDVAFLRSEADSARRLHGPFIAEAYDFDSLAARIAALLPPENDAH